MPTSNQRQSPRDAASPISLRFANGARLLMMPGPPPARGGRGVACVQLWIHAGAAAERSREHGCAHLFEHMVFKPWVDAEGRSHDLASAIEALGGDVNAFTSHDETVFHATLPGDAIEEALAILLPAVTSRPIDPALLDREKQVVIEEIHQYEDDPAARSIQALMADLYGDHPYARPVLGELEELRALTAARLRGWQRRQCRGESLTLVVTGCTDPSAVETQARALLEPLPGSKPSAERPAKRGWRRAARALDRAHVRVERCDVQEAYLRLGWLGGEALDDDSVALDVAAVVLGQGESSRLATQIRRRAQLVSDVHASYLAGLASGALLVSAQTEHDKVADALFAVLDGVEAMGQHPLPEAELQRARALLQSSLIYRRESVQGLAHALGYYATIDGIDGIASVDDNDGDGSEGAEARYFRALAQLDPAAVQRSCARLLCRERAAITVYLPRADTTAKQARALAKQLERRCAAKHRCRPGRRFAPLTRDRHGIVRTRHDSGLRVLVRPDPRVPVVGAWLVWPGGLRVETPRLAGVSSLTAALLNRGTSSRSGDALAREVEGLAAVIDGFAGHNSVGIQSECLSQHFPAILERAIDCARDPLFDAGEVDEARRITLADLEADGDDPGYLAYRTMLASLYRKHPLGRDLRGTAASLSRLDAAALRRNWDRRYGLGKAVLAVAGEVEPEALLASLAPLLDALEPGDAVEGPPTWPGGPPKWPRRPRHVELAREREQGQLVLGFPGLALGDPRGAALDVLCSVLGGQSGRLFEALREREGLVYQVSASAAEHVDAGHLVVHAAASQDKLAATRAAIDRELETIRTQAITTEELQRSKRWLIGQFESAMQRRSRIASRMVFAEVYGLGADYYFGYPARVQAVTRAQVLSLAAELLDPKRMVSVALSS